MSSGFTGGGGAVVVGGAMWRVWGCAAEVVEVVTGTRVRGVGLGIGVSSSSVDRRASAAWRGWLTCIVYLNYIFCT